MPLASGTRVGPYEVVGWLGAGGMGEVYRARDPRFARDVAIKLIPETLATDRTRLHRFEQEARAVGQLNHPNILAVYDIGTHEGAPFIVSELLEGQTLRQGLTPGTALSSRKAVDYARQIADGLAAAHDKGIVHRDLKPENLFVTNDGRVKILDFGIAKLTRASDDILPETGFPTETAEGMIVGTIGYMSPEQVRGETLDPRSDLFNFGTILYEMLAGRVAFTRATAAETVAAILKEDPPAPLPSTVSPALSRIVSRCLEKTREARFQSARDLAFGLEFLSGEHRTSAVGRAVRGYPRSWLGHRTVPWVLAAVLGLALVIAVALNFIGPPAVSEASDTLVERFLPGGDKQLDGSGGGHMIAISRDGKQVVYVATPFGLYHRFLTEPEAKAIPGTESYSGVREPVLSPDGKSVAFFVVDDQTIKRMPLAGGPVQPLCAAEQPFGMSWGVGGITYGQGANGVWRVPENGGEKPMQLAEVNPGEEAHGPQVLPGGRYVLFTLATGSGRDRWNNARIVVQSISDRSDRRVIVSGGSDARYVEKTGHIVYAFGTKLFAMVFDPQQPNTIGDGIPIFGGVGQASGSATGAAQFSFSDTGRLIYVPAPVGASNEQLDLAIMTRAGEVTPLGLPPGAYAVPRASPDGANVVFGNDGEPGIIWVAALSANSQRVAIADKGNNRFPIWRGNKQVVFQSNLEGDGLYSRAADGSGKATLLVRALLGESYAPESWHPNKDVLLLSITRDSDISLATWSPGDKTPTPFGSLHSSAPFGATFSHDGKWVAYSVEEKRVTTMYVQPFPAGEPQRFPSVRADTPKHPIWAPGDSELIYNPRQKDFEAVSIRTAPKFGFGSPPTKVPKLLSGGHSRTRTAYDIVTTGDMVGLITWGKKEFVRPWYNEIRLKQGWFEDLLAKVPRR